jgi:hypothetical protein
MVEVEPILFYLAFAVDILIVGYYLSLVRGRNTSPFFRFPVVVASSAVWFGVHHLLETTPYSEIGEGIEGIAAVSLLLAYLLIYRDTKRISGLVDTKGALATDDASPVEVKPRMPRGGAGHP